MSELTLDNVQSAFRDNPTVSMAERYAAVVREYHEDGMVGDATLNAALREIDAFYVNRDCA